MERTKATGEGKGMGLAVVHGIVESYGGHISMNSDPGIGTTFVIDLPAVRCHTSSRTATPEKLPLGSERILPVDDNPDVAEMTGEIPKRLGYAVKEEQ